MNKPILSTADKVLEHLDALENRKQQYQKHQTTSIKHTSPEMMNDEFSDSELATLINPQRMKALMEQADGFLNDIDSMIDEFDNIDGI